MADLFWLPDEQWAVVGRFMPTNQPEARRVDDRRVVSGIRDAFIRFKHDECRNYLAAAGYDAYDPA